jgi:hypothetical protein
VPVREVRPGDVLLGRGGERVAVEEVYDTGKEEAVYNLRVADFHTYFVGDTNWGFSVWAHNMCTPEEVAQYAKKYAEIAEANGGKFYKAWDKVAPGRTLSAADKRAIRQFIRDNPEQFPGVSIKTRNSGGLAGDTATQAFDESVARRLQARGWEMQNGPLSGNPQEWIRGPVPGSREGGTQIDMTATKMIGGRLRTLRAQTIDTLADGITPTPREAANAARIRAEFPDDHLLLVPKPR